MKKVISILLLIILCNSIYTQNEFNFKFEKKVIDKIKLKNPTFMIAIQLDTFLFVKNNNGTFSIIDNYYKFTSIVDSLKLGDTLNRYCKLFITTNKYVYMFEIDLFEFNKVCNNYLKIITIDKLKNEKFYYAITYCSFFYYCTDGIRQKIKK